MSAKAKILYHVVIAPKYRRAVLHDVTPFTVCDYKIAEIVAEHAAEVDRLAIQPDHIHIFIRASVGTDIPKMVARIKAITSREIRRNPRYHQIHPKAFWSGGYFVCTVGSGNNASAVRRYLEAQSVEE